MTFGILYMKQQTEQFLEENFRGNKNKKYHSDKALDKIRLWYDSWDRRFRVRGQLSFLTTCVQFWICHYRVMGLCLCEMDFFLICQTPTQKHLIQFFSNFGILLGMMIPGSLCFFLISDSSLWSYGTLFVCKAKWTFF